MYERDLSKDSPLSMNPWFSLSNSQKLRSNSQKGEWNGFEEHFEKRPLMPLTNGVTPFLETPFKKIAVSTWSIFFITLLLTF